MNLVRFSGKLAVPDVALAPDTPLWKIVPLRDEDGRPLSDFMLLIPKLRLQPQPYIDSTISSIQQVLEQYREVVFVHLNLAINVLWVSVKNRPGVILELVVSIQERVPEAVLVAQPRC
jgi:hypothetical protein